MITPVVAAKLGVPAFALKGPALSNLPPVGSSPS